MKKLICVFFVLFMGAIFLVPAQSKFDAASLSITVKESIPDTVLIPSLEILTIFSESKNFALNEKIKTLKHLKSLSILVESQSFEIPKWIGELKNLEELYVKWSVVEIPASIYQLKNLKALSLVGFYNELPKGISKLKGLHYLNISSPNLSELSEEIFELKYLGFLGISGTKVERIPPSINQLKYIEFLDLGDNLINSLSSMSNCKKLMEVNLHENRISPFEMEQFKTELPKVVIKYDYNLQKFNHNRTYKAILADSKNTARSVRDAIKKKKKIEVLDLSNNEEIKEELKLLASKVHLLGHIKVLKLNGNSLTEIPKSIFKLSQLKELYLTDNHLTDLPEELFSMSNLRILNIGKNDFAQLNRGLLQLHQLAMLVIDGAIINQYILNSVNKCLPNVKVIEVK